MIFIFNKRRISKHISVIDRGLSYGDGLFETMSWTYLDDEKVLGVEFWDRHIERIKQRLLNHKNQITVNRNFKKLQRKDS